jgi:CBS domain-containing protein
MRIRGITLFLFGGVAELGDEPTSAGTEFLLWTGVWFALIGLFLNKATRSGYQQILIRQALQGEPVGRFMNPQPITVPPHLDLRHWVEDYVYRYDRKAFPVAENSHLEGFISTQALARVPREEWDRHTVGELMRQDTSPIAISPHADAMQARSKMQATGSSRLLVTEEDRLLGIVSLKDLLRFLNLKLELENCNGRRSDLGGDRTGADRGSMSRP